jgi:hypothetical protein
VLVPAIKLGHLDQAAQGERRVPGTLERLDRALRGSDRSRPAAGNARVSPWSPELDLRRRGIQRRLAARPRRQPRPGTCGRKMDLWIYLPAGKPDQLIELMGGGENRSKDRISAGLNARGPIN